MVEAIEGVFEKASLASKDEKLRLKYAQMDYDKIIDFKLIDKYALKYKNDTCVQNVRKMADIFGMVSKLVFADTKDGGLDFVLTNNETKKLKSLEQTFSSASIKNELNQYAIDKNLGIISFLLHKWNQSIVFFNKAIEEFPEKKQTQHFSSGENYDALLTIYKLNKDSVSFKKILMEKIKREPDGRKNVSDYLRLAIVYYTENDIVEAEAWASKANAIDSKNFQVLRLLSHLNYLKGNDFECQFYANYATQYATSNYDLYLLNMQFAIYHLISGNAKEAHGNIANGRLAIEKESCELCDKLTNNYIKVINK